ncbi:TB2/DP1, HVA22 family-domain-containing protein [Fimicolochytrium jonesii]|uniref:TB2/DP1, HVA22 family-domain-containing protein n=1 Tax=Fimicolochytrium jonesii TaxID=1396493 RepID=UPI0022FEFFE4|nr:TB2/DP1, HVA22 family-domain-containing protein [Fimicolochytrium jonesii]KAI8818023.1 TB2/DP1, HVA22 family-domain-containing protein [Fimicolochytrium jonesii]
MTWTYTLARIFGSFIGYVCPAYYSYKAVKERNEEALDWWLIHWMVISAFTVFENIGDTLLFWVPLYFELKLMIIILLVLPWTNGSTLIYKHILQPTLTRHEPNIDNALTRAQKATARWFVKSGETAFAMLRNAVVEALLTGQSAITLPGRRLSRSLAAATSHRKPNPRIVEVTSDDDDYKPSPTASHLSPPAVTRSRASSSDPSTSPTSGRSPRKRAVRTSQGTKGGSVRVTKTRRPSTIHGAQWPVPPDKKSGGGNRSD